MDGCSIITHSSLPEPEHCGTVTLVVLDSRRCLKRNTLVWVLDCARAAMLFARELESDTWFLLAGEFPDPDRARAAVLQGKTLIQRTAFSPVRWPVTGPPVRKCRLGTNAPDDELQANSERAYSLTCHGARAASAASGLRARTSPLARNG